MNFISSLFNFIPHIIVLVAVIQYLNKFSGAEGVLMLIGTIIGTLISLFYSMVLPYLGRDNGYENIQQYITIVSIVGTLGALSFAIGLLLAVQKLVSDKKQ